MSWLYHFIDLTDAQKQNRRELLDKYATFAQISPLGPLLAIQCYYFLSWLSRRKHDGDSPGSPRRKEEWFGHQVGIARVQTFLERIGWWCGEPVEIGNFYLGLRGEVLAALSWLAWLLFLCFPQTDDGEDFLRSFVSFA